MVFENLKKELFKIREAIDLCISKKIVMPSLILIYSGIDVLGWLEYGDSLKSGPRFRKWADSYILPLPRSSCNATDLWGARCGLIHTFTADSDLSRKNKARKIVYAWGTSEINTLNEMILLGKMNDYVAVKIEDLSGAFQNGIESFLVDSERRPEKAKTIYARANGFFRTMSQGEANTLLDRAKSILEQTINGK